MSMDVFSYQPVVGQDCWPLEYTLTTVINSQISSFKIQIIIKFQYIVGFPLDLITPCRRSEADSAGLAPTDVTAAVRSA
jgi:hypothetical protein